MHQVGDMFCERYLMCFARGFWRVWCALLKISDVLLWKLLDSPLVVLNMSCKRCLMSFAKYIMWKVLDVFCEICLVKGVWCVLRYMSGEKCLMSFAKYVWWKVFDVFCDICLVKDVWCLLQYMSGELCDRCLVKGVWCPLWKVFDVLCERFWTCLVELLGVSCRERPRVTFAFQRWSATRLPPPRRFRPANHVLSPPLSASPCWPHPQGVPRTALS